MFPACDHLARALVRVLMVAALPACGSLVPLRDPPALLTEAPPGVATSRSEVIARFGPPAEVRASDPGDVLVYRRLVVVNISPNRYWGEDRRGRLDRYERVLLYLDQDGRIVRRLVEAE